MKNKRIAKLMLTVLLIGGGLVGCTSQADIDSALTPVQQQVDLINTTLDEMKSTDTTLHSNINSLTTRVSTLESTLTIVQAIIESLSDDLDDTKKDLTQVQTTLTNEINLIKEDINDLKDKDEDLQDQINALSMALDHEINGIKEWTSETYLTITNWNSFKTEINEKINNLFSRVTSIETSINVINTTLSALQQQVDKNTQDIEDLTIRVNCLEGNHVADSTTAAYNWSNDFSTCTASCTCKHCGATISETADSTVLNNAYTVSFTSKDFSSQTCDLENAFSIIFATEPSTLTLTLPHDFNSFNLIDDLIKSYGENKYINLTLKGVEKIPMGAFSQNNKLVSITIPKSVTSIEASAFDCCNMLKDIYYEGELSDWLKININGVYHSGSTVNLYINGTLVENIKIPAGINEIGSHFAGCTTLKSVTISKDVTTIGNYAFNGCTALNNLFIPSSVTSIGKQAFENCSSLKSVAFSESSKLESIGEKAFYYCNAFTEITIPASVNSIGKYAFGSCGALKTVTFADNCAITDLYCTFATCSSLENVDFGKNSAITVIKGYTFSFCNALKSITFPASVNIIGDHVFEASNALTDITFEGIITKLGTYPFGTDINSNLTLTFAKGQKNFTKTGDGSFTITDTDIVAGTNVIFCGCYIIKEIIIAEE